MDILLQQIINGLVLGSMYALIALGYTMVYGIINLINFAHGEVMMVGALTSWTIIGMMQESMPGTPGAVILLIALVIACVVAAALNFTIEKVAYRPLRNSPKLAPLITAIGMSILLQTLAMIIWKPNYKSYPTLLPNTPIEIGGAVISPTQVMILGFTAVSLAVLMWLVNYTKLGRAMRATAENPSRGRLDGREAGCGDFCYLHHWCCACGHRRCHVCVQLRNSTACHGFLTRFEGIYRGCFRWHRQSWRRRCWCDFAGSHRINRGGLHWRADRGCPGQPLLGYFCFYRPDHCVDAATLRFAG
jgi:hypothetical protein